MGIWGKIKSAFRNKLPSDVKTDEPVPIHIAENWEQYSVGEDVEPKEIHFTDGPNSPEFINSSELNFPDPDPNFKPDYSLKPDAVCLNTDDYHLEHFGKTEDGLFVWLGSQLNYDHKLQRTTHYVFKFVFDESGDLISSDIQTVGSSSVSNHRIRVKKMTALLDSVSEISPATTMIKTFTVMHEGIEFGLIAQAPYDEDEDWYILFMPGDTMAFYPPFDICDYDT